jgi:hypothetical protein
MRSGDKVVCIDAKFPLGIEKYYVALPTEGTVYVVRDMIDGGTWTGEPEVAVYLIGLHNPKSDKPPYFERGFSAKRFRPLDEMQGRRTESVAKEEESPMAVPANGV